jgi:hypothetical protein
MRITRLCATLLIIAASMAHARNPKAYQTGQIAQVNSLPCSGEQNNTQQLCPEYILQSNFVVYHLRPSDSRHAPTLSVGERIQFRRNKEIILLRSEVAGSKERPFVVISISPASDNTADLRPVRLNHLQ